MSVSSASPKVFCTVTCVSSKLTFYVQMSEKIHFSFLSFQLRAVLCKYTDPLTDKTPAQLKQSKLLLDDSNKHCRSYPKYIFPLKNTINHLPMFCRCFIGGQTFFYSLIATLYPHLDSCHCFFYAASQNCILYKTNLFHGFSSLQPRLTLCLTIPADKPHTLRIQADSHAAMMKGEMQTPDLHL